MTRRVLRITLDLRLDGKTVSGQAIGAGGHRLPFSGWVALFALLDRLVAEAEPESPAAALFGEPSYRPAAASPAIDSPHGAYTVLVAGTEPGGGYSALEVVLPPGGEHPAHSHRDQELALYVIEGEGTFQLGADSIATRAGDFFNIPRGCVHGFRNGGASPARVLLTLVPASVPEVATDPPTRELPDDDAERRPGSHAGRPQRS